VSVEPLVLPLAAETILGANCRRGHAAHGRRVLHHGQLSPSFFCPSRPHRNLSQLKLYLLSPPPTAIATRAQLAVVTVAARMPSRVADPSPIISDHVLTTHGCAQAWRCYGTFPLPPTSTFPAGTKPSLASSVFESRPETLCNNRSSSKGFSTEVVTQVNSALHGFSFSFFYFLAKTCEFHT
jgi:hypothetical protein